MTKRFIAILLAVSMLLLTGCQLAHEEAQPETADTYITDRLVGMLISVAQNEPVEENAIHSFASEGKKLYAQLLEETVTGADGAERITHSYRFPEGSGIAYMGYYVRPEGVELEEPYDGYWSSTADEGIYPEKNLFKTVNTVSAVELEGIVYVAETAKELVLYMNPVYQTPEGEVYALGTAPMGYLAATMDGCAVSHGMDVEETERGNTARIQQGYVKMTMEVIRLPEKYVIVQMDAENQVIEKGEFLPNAMPEVFTPSEQCSYVILECYSAGSEVARTVYSPDDGSYSLDSFYPLENGICVKGHTELNWEGAS